MIYGMILTEHNLLSRQEQHNGVVDFAKKNGLKIDSFLSYRDMPDIGGVKQGDSVVFYAWSCVGKTRLQMKKTISYLLENKINFYSATGKYNVAAGSDFNQLSHAFGLYEDIRFSFISDKNQGAIKRRIARGETIGRRPGIKNKTHVWDNVTPDVLSMYNRGFSMYRIARDLNLNAPAVKRCLVANNMI